jgi:hypothetical protein
MEWQERVLTMLGTPSHPEDTQKTQAPGSSKAGSELGIETPVKQEISGPSMTKPSKLVFNHRLFGRRFIIFERG